jgi:hypothetical protein
MARRSARTDTPAETTEENTVTTVTEPDLTDTSDLTDADLPAEDEASDTASVTTEGATVEPTADEAPEQAAEPEYTLDAFKEAVAAALPHQDPETGDLPESAVAPVQEQYRALPAKGGRPSAKAFLQSSMKDSINALQWINGKSYMQLAESMTAGSAAKAEKVPADPKAAFTERYQALLLALALVAEQAPEGVEASEIDVPADLLDSGRAYVTWSESEAEDKGDAPESSAVVRNAVKIASGKAATGRKASTSGGTSSGGSGLRRDIAKHIDSAFEGLEAGAFLSIADIRKHKSDEYGDEQPSAGAISARLFPASGKSTLTSVTPGFGGAEGKTRGATKN